ncbi:hypothetical protein [Dechloromonas sp. A34]|uniref:hypothetical protein n=1 Tax=Dechloromonas sp. A34 TaxID=447588 RepID=UPI00224932A0|nr:hypothetical protein [Dechloromonas sp. A34]
MDIRQADQKAMLSLHEAAQLLSTDTSTIHEFEVSLALAIEHGQLHASVKRWATEQWEGKQLPGNINRRETFIARVDLEAWRKART